MSSILDQALGESQRRADRMVEHALSSHQGGGRKAPNAVWQQPAAPSPASAPGVLGGMVSGLTGLGSQQQQAMFHHREQMRHYAGWVYSCIRPIAQRIAGQAVRVARGKKKAAGKNGGSRPKKDLIPRNIKTLTDDMDVLEQHPLLDAINNPNAIMVRWILLYVTVVYLELTGRAFWWIRKREQDPGNKASPAPAFEIWPLPPSWVEPVHEEDKLYASWQIRPEGSAEAVSVPGEEIVQIYYPDPSNPLGCIAPLQAQSRAVVADEAIVEAQRRSFQNGLHFGALITVGRHPDVPGVAGARPILSREQRAQIVSAIKQFYRGVVHHDEPLILDGLIENVQRFTQTPREMDYQTSGKLTKERISQGFGVNPIIMGQVEGANRASSASADDHFCSSTVNPKIELISECLTAWLAPRFSAPGEKLLIYLEPASAYDPDLELSRQRFLQSVGALSINEARAANGYPPIEGGDVCLISNMLMPVSVTREGEGGISFLKPVDPDKPPAQGGNGGGGAGGNGGGGAGGDGQDPAIDDPLAGKGGKK
jgi:phage portal protein BeeE